VGSSNLCGWFCKTVEAMSKVYLLASLTTLSSLAIPQFPSFSWNTLPVAWHSALDRNFSADELQVLAKYATVTFEKTQGASAFPWDGDKHGMMVCQNGTDMSQCGCCEEDYMISAAKALKAISNEVHIFAYTNSIIAYPWYSGAHEFNGHPDLWLRDVNGTIMNNIKQNPIETWHAWDHSQDDASKIWASQCKNMVGSGAIDGCFVDGCMNVPSPLEPEKSQAYASKKPAMLSDLQQEIPGVLICGSGGSWHEGMLGTQVQNWGKHGDYSVREIPMLMKAMEAGVMFHAHGSAVCRNQGNASHPDVQTELAAFLIAAQEHAYYMCSGWSGTVPTWYPVYDKKLGAPIANATLVDGVYTRTFTSGTKVTYDTTSETGSINWADVVV